MTSSSERVVAHFPEKYFLENLAVRADGSVLLTAMLQRELWLVAGPDPHTETAPDVFIVCLSDGCTTHESHLARINLNGWVPGDPVVSAEFVAAIDNADDPCLDEDIGFASGTRHRGNSLDRVPLQPRHSGEVRHLAGVPFDLVLAGPFGGARRRRITAPPNGIVRRASLLRCSPQVLTSA